MFVKHIEHQIATDDTSLEKALKNFYNTSNNVKLLEIKTPRLENNKILLNYFDFIS